MMRWLLPWTFLALTILIAVDHASAGGFERDDWGVETIPDHKALTSADSEMSLLTMMHALAVRNPRLRYAWINSQSGNGGEYTIMGAIPSGRFKGCMGLANHVVITSTGEEYWEYPAACQGDVRSNTWTLNGRWVISSLIRAKNQNCVTRFTDIRLRSGWMNSTRTICRNHNVWETIQ